MQTPIVKFIGSAVSLMTFVCMQVAFAFTENPSKGHRLSEDGKLGPSYLWYNASTPDPEIQDAFIRNDEFRVLYVVIGIFVLGRCRLCNLLAVGPNQNTSWQLACCAHYLSQN